MILVMLLNFWVIIIVLEHFKYSMCIVVLGGAEEWLLKYISNPDLERDAKKSDIYSLE